MYAYYFVQFDFTGNSVFGAVAATSTVCGTAGQTYGCPTYIPTGVANSGNTLAGSGLAAGNGVGSNHVPIGYGIFVNLPDATANMGTNADAEVLVITFNLATARCSVTETTRSDIEYEKSECSGRGSCDRTSGLCACFEGFYGDHCSLQTILV